MVTKIREIRPKRWGDYGPKDLWKRFKFWVWSETEMEWCIVKVIMMMMMMNWWEKH